MYFMNTTIENYQNNDIRIIYLIQTSGKLPELYNCLRNKHFILLSYKEQTNDTTIFFPKSTWTDGRNKLREYIINNNIIYDYYVFLDDDIKFKDFSQEEGFNLFELKLKNKKPLIATPLLEGYYNTDTNVKYDINVEYVEWFDAIMNAYSHDIFYSNKIFPYNNTYDSTSWWVSQYIIILLCDKYYKNKVILFKDLVIIDIKIKNISNGNIYFFNLNLLISILIR